MTYHRADGRADCKGQVLVGGDSAEGNLVLGLISILSHDHPCLSGLQSHGESFKDAVLISPWVTFDQNAASFGTNRLKDNVTAKGLKKWSDAYLDLHQSDFFNTPLGAPEGWWRNLPFDRILILAGGDELFVDDICDMASKMKVRKPKARVLYPRCTNLKGNAGSTCDSTIDLIRLLSL